MKYFLLLTMIFCHVIDDFHLQGVLANMKQKSWWGEHYPNEIYNHDYIAALVIHSFSWSFMIQLPVMATLIQRRMLTNESVALFCLMLAVNMAIHGCVDHLKANLYVISLIKDQTVHLIQILLTWAVFTIITGFIG